MYYSILKKKKKIADTNALKKCIDIFIFFSIRYRMSIVCFYFLRISYLLILKIGLIQETGEIQKATIVVVLALTKKLVCITLLTLKRIIYHQICKMILSRAQFVQVIQLLCD